MQVLLRKQPISSPHQRVYRAQLSLTEARMARRNRLLSMHYRSSPSPPACAAALSGGERCRRRQRETPARTTLTDGSILRQGGAGVTWEVEAWTQCNSSRRRLQCALERSIIQATKVTHHTSERPKLALEARWNGDYGPVSNRWPAPSMGLKCLPPRSINT